MSIPIQWVLYKVLNKALPIQWILYSWCKSWTRELGNLGDKNMLNKVESEHLLESPKLSVSICHFNEPTCSGKQKFAPQAYESAVA